MNNTEKALYYCNHIQSSIKWLGAKSEFSVHGICTAFQVLTDFNTDIIDAVRKHFTTWPEKSKHPAFPVPSYDPHLTADEQYVSAHTMWEGEYGKARMRLLEHCINQLQLELNRRSTKYIPSTIKYYKR